MNNLLLVTLSLFGNQSKSTQIAGGFVDAWCRTHAGTTVVER
jgi:FMN-dependent NADH-azoreductase